MVGRGSPGGARLPSVPLVEADLKHGLWRCMDCGGVSAPFLKQSVPCSFLRAHGGRGADHNPRLPVVAVVAYRPQSGWFGSAAEDAVPCLVTGGLVA